MNFAHAGNLRPPCKPGWPRTWKRLLLQAPVWKASNFVSIYRGYDLLENEWIVPWRGTISKRKACLPTWGTIFRGRNKSRDQLLISWFVCEETSRCGNSLLGIEGRVFFWMQWSFQTVRIKFNDAWRKLAKANMDPELKAEKVVEDVQGWRLHIT